MISGKLFLAPVVRKVEPEPGGVPVPMMFKPVRSSNLGFSNTPLLETRLKVLVSVAALINDISPLALKRMVCLLVVILPFQSLFAVRIGNWAVAPTSMVFKPNWVAVPF